MLTVTNRKRINAKQQSETFKVYFNQFMLPGSRTRYCRDASGISVETNLMTCRECSKYSVMLFLHQRLNPSLAFLCIAVFHFGIQHNETDNVWITNVLLISSYLKLFTCATGKVWKLKLRESENKKQQTTKSNQL